MISVMFLVLLADRFIPEIGDFVYEVEEAIMGKAMLRFAWLWKTEHERRT